MVGGVVSTTVTVWTQVLALPDASLAVWATEVVPRGYVAAPGSGTVVAPHGSDAEARPAATTALPAREHSAVTSAGQLMEGAVVSFTVTVFTQLAWLPDESVATCDTEVVPSGYIP